MRKLDLFKLGDFELSDLAARAKAETERRTREATAEAGSEIIGGEMAKRALIVAAAGKHSILFVGAPGTGKTLYRAVAARLGLTDTFECRPCPCGNYGNVYRPCGCTASRIGKMKFPVTDITIEIHTPSQREREAKFKFTQYTEMKEQIDRLGTLPSEFDQHAENLLKSAVSEFGFSIARVAVFRSIARTVAALESATVVTATHMNEAVMYRGFNA